MASTSDQPLQLTTSTSAEEPTKDSQHVKSNSSTAQTAPVESSEEFTLSGEMTTSSCADLDTTTPTLQLSNMVILEEQQLQHQQHGRVRFAADVTIIPEVEIVAPPLSKKKSRKSMVKELQDESLREVTASDIWWSHEELEALERDAAYMVKESQQYQEEVIVTVLYNKAFLSAASLADNMAEDDMEEQLQDVTQYSNTLEKWTDVGNSRRGLENMVSEKAVVHAIQSRMDFLQFQKALKEGGNNPSHHADFLAHKCQDLSRTARILARMMGQADADSLATAETLCAATPSLPEPPGRYSGDHEYNVDTTSERVSRRNRRGSLLKTVGKAVGNVFRRQSSREVNIRRIRKIQQRQQAEQEPPKRPSEEFRRSFLDSLDYGEQ